MSAYLTSVCGDLGKYLRQLPQDILLHSVYTIRGGTDTLKGRVPLIDKSDSQCAEDELHHVSRMYTHTLNNPQFCQVKKNTEKNPDKMEGKHKEQCNQGEVFSGAG